MTLGRLELRKIRRLGKVGGTTLNVFARLVCERRPRRVTEVRLWTWHDLKVLAVFASLRVAYENPFVSREDKERCSFMLSKQNPIRSGSMATAPKGISSWILWICFYSFLWCPLQPRQQPLRLPEHFWKLSLSKTQAAWLS